MLRKVVFYALELDIIVCASKPITLYDNKLTYVHKATRYLGVTLCSGKCFGVDLRSGKSNLYSSFNSIFHSATSYQNELVVLHLVFAYCKPYLLYGSECMDVNVTQIRGVEHTWQLLYHSGCLLIFCHLISPSVQTEFLLIGLPAQLAKISDPMAQSSHAI